MSAEHKSLFYPGFPFSSFYLGELWQAKAVMTTYGIIKLNSDDKPVVALVDVEGSQPSFTEADKEEISAYFFGRPPPEISIQIAHSQDCSRSATVIGDEARCPLYI
jgi:hypothetical protein